MHLHEELGKDGGDMTQPTALRLADALEHDAATQKIYHRPLVEASAAELRRLHSTCEELGEMVERLTEGALATAQRTKELEASNAELLAAQSGVAVHGERGRTRRF